MSPLGFYFDMNRCIGCKACQIACKDVNDLEVGTLFRKVVHYETGSFPNVGAFNYSATCNHCAEPQCVKVCPVGAMHKADDGTVQHDEAACLGCQYCVMACPYGVPKFDDRLGVSKKCTSCAPLRAQGEEPACVASCTMRCIDFGEIDDLRAKYGIEGVQDLSILPDSSITKPSLLVNSKSEAMGEDVRPCLL